MHNIHQKIMTAAAKIAPYLSPYYGFFYIFRRPIHSMGHLLSGTQTLTYLYKGLETNELGCASGTYVYVPMGEISVYTPRGWRYVYYTSYFLRICIISLSW